METDENVFFRKATLKICGSLEIETALWQCLLYIRSFIPADFLTLTNYDVDSGISKTIATARLTGGIKLMFETRGAPEARAIMNDWYKEPDSDTHVRIVENVINDEVLGSVLKSVDKETLVSSLKMDADRLNLLFNASAMQMRLKLEGRMLGTLIAGNTSGQPFRKSHVRLLALLNEPFTIALSNFLSYHEVLILKDLLADDKRFLQKELSRFSGEQIIGADFGMRGVMELVQQVGSLDSPVLLIGETGTGKELVASAIHNLSTRKNGPFIKINCGAIPGSLMDSELFGHEKGAFTGAISQKKGRFERAHGGTIFLDEIGELAPEAQVRLLRVLQEKEIERVGGAEPIKVDIRVIAATHRDLETMLGQETFREDLYFRLKVFPIIIPPLRDRKSDIPALTHHFIQKKSLEMGFVDVSNPSSDVLDRLLSYRWPGNVRELENTVERALILSKGEQLTFPDFFIRDGSDAEKASDFSNMTSLELDQIMSDHITKVMEMTKGKINGESGAAALLNINPSTLRKRMRKLGIAFGQKWKKQHIEAD